MKPATVIPSKMTPAYTKVRSKHIRRLCLQHLDAVRPGLATDHALLATIQAVYPKAELCELQRELDYLALKGLLTTTDVAGVWQLRLTRQGVQRAERLAGQES